MPLSFPSSPSAGTTYPALPNGLLYVFDGYSWVMQANARTLALSGYFTSFLFRTIYTRGYTHCGYQNSSPWRNTNRTLHNTDTTTNLGDMMDNIQSYMDGGFSDFHTYCFNDSGGVQTTGNLTSIMNMTTETLRGHNGGADMKQSRQNLKALMNPSLTIIYCTGGNYNSTEKLYTFSDTMLGLNTGITGNGNSGGTVGGLSGFFGQYYGIVGANSSSGFLNFSNETWSNGGWSFASSTDGQPKGLSSKHGVGYNASGSYAGSSTYYKFNDTTGSQLSTMSRPESCGEENCQVGQDWGYTLGSYDGNQTNNTTKVSYLTDSVVAGGSTMQPKGHGGMSSGCCGTGCCYLLGGVPGSTM